MGPNAWVALVQPVPSGGIPANTHAVEAKFTFKDGAYDWHTRFCQVKERLAQVMEARGLSGGAANAEVGESVNLEQLPAYEEVGIGVPVAAPVQEASREPLVAVADTERVAPAAAAAAPISSATPAEPPPGYDEVQRDSVVEELERGLRLRNGS